jgi:cholesterol oxidase
VQTTVHSFEKLIDHYRVHFTHHAIAPDGSVHAIPGSATTRILILAAGSLSTTEILLRSRSPHLRLSPRLGYDWNNNGNVLATVDSHQRKKSEMESVATNFSRPHIGELTGRKWNDRIQIVRSLRLPHDEREVWMAIGHDPARGQLSLDEQGQLTLDWAGNRSSLYLQRAKAEIRRWASALQCRAEFPKDIEGMSLYALGGCIMADDPQSGVVNPFGQVYDLSFGGDVDPVSGYYRVHSGLYAIGSATVPSTMGCAPQLTVAAIGARTSDLLTLDPLNGEIFTL